jgi:glycerophosphoryl diester phosphodiesterase
MVMACSPVYEQPGFLVAHRAGNDLDRLRDAELLGARLIEADIQLHHGRLEVRHLKSVGPLPIYWDHWYLANPFARRLQLHELLAAAGPKTELMLDLKGSRRRLAHLVRAELAKCASRQSAAVTVCARSWKLLEPFADDENVRTVCSVGSRRGLRRLLEAQRRSGKRVGGVSIHARLLTPTTVNELRDAAEIVMTWPVNSIEQGQRLLDWGVHGLITDVPHSLDALIETPTEVMSA